MIKRCHIIMNITKMNGFVRYWHIFFSISLNQLIIILRAVNWLKSELIFL